jgi:acyl carrier protein
MSRQERITEIVQRVSKNQTAPDPDESLFDSGYLDSFALTDMVSEIEREFGISIPDSDLTPRRFDSVRKIDTYVAKWL